jgi:short-subunit dehydrogenase
MLRLHRFRRDLSGRGVVVVGASSGIGRAAAELFAANGCRLVLAARGGPELDEAADACRRAGAPMVMTCAVDIGQRDDVTRLAHAACSSLRTIDVWVNLAAVLDSGDLTDARADEVERVIATNVTGTVLLSRAALRAFDVQGSGTLINVGSLNGIMPHPLLPVYSATKFAARGLTMALQHSRRPRSIAVCLVLPGPVDTPIFAHPANHTGRSLRAIPPAASPWRMAAAIVRCARRPRRVVTLGIGRPMLVAHRLAPRAMEWAVARYAAATVRRRDPQRDTSGNVFAPAHDGRVSAAFRRGRRRRRLGDRIGRAAAG